ncbi:MAG: protein kinase [Pirellulaceae bacterium]
MPLGAQCDAFELDRYLTADGTHEERLAFEQHLDACQACRRKLEGAAADDGFWEAASENLDTRKDPVSSTMSTQQLLSVIEKAMLGDGLEGNEASSQSAYKSTSFATRSYLQHWLTESKLDVEPGTKQQHGSGTASLGWLDKYEVLQVLDSGGMGLVLKAYDPGLKRMVAIKTLRQHLADNPAALKRFAREAQLAASLRHPSIINIYAVDVWRDVPYLVMPFLEEGNLNDYAHGVSQPFRIDEILAVAEQIAAGLCEAHSQAMVHRDLKPSNILLENGLQIVVLTDFGLARAMDDNGLTYTGFVAGTPQFMSPEQARGSKVDMRSDIFSFGSLLFWLATRHSPFAAESSYGTLTKIIHDPHPPVANWRDDLPRWFQRLVDLLLAKDPDQRSLDAEQLVQVLHQCRQHVADPAIHALPAQLQVSGQRGYQRHWPWIASAIGLVATTVVAMNLGWLDFTRTSLAGLHDVAQASTAPASNATNQQPPPPSVAMPSTPATTVEQPRSESSIVAASREGELTRRGPLDSLDEANLLSDLGNAQRTVYWLTRLAELPVEDISPAALSAVEPYALSNNPQLRELAAAVLNKNPFQELKK